MNSSNFRQVARKKLICIMIILVGLLFLHTIKLLDIGLILLIVSLTSAIIKSYYYQLAYFIASDEPEMKAFAILILDSHHSVYFHHLTKPPVFLPH